MAAAHEVPFDDFFTCSICLHTFKIPKYLPCLHSFCETCLDTYIQTSISKKNEQNSTGFLCPVCRSLVSLSDSSENPTTWAKQMPVNKVFMSIMDRRAIEKSEKLCDACILDKKKEIAVSWCVVCQEAFCSTCEKYHRNFRVSSAHRIISIKDSSPKDTDILLAGSTIQCEQHNEKAIEVYCVEHTKPCCTLCATLNHRGCEKLVPIEKAVSGFKNSIQLKTMSDTLEKMSSQLDEIVHKRNENILQIEGKKNEILLNAVKLNESVIIQHDKLHNTFRNELECVTKQVLLPLKDQATVLSSYKCTIDNWKAILRSCLSYGSEQQFFVEANKICLKMEQMDNEVNNLTSKMRDPSLQFTPNITLVKLQADFTSFGEVEIDNFRNTSIVYLPTVNFKDGNIKVISTIKVDIGKDSKNAISGIFFGDFIILTDRANKKVLKYDEKGVLIKDLKLNDVNWHPTDITRVEEDTVAVSAGFKCIVIIRVTDMAIQQKIDLSYSFNRLVHGLQYIDNCFVCACMYQITWINAYTGQIVNKRETKHETVFLHASKNQDLIFAEGEKISRLSNDQLQILYENKNMRNPAGIDVDFERNIYVCGGNTSDNIYQLTKEGVLIRTIPTATLGIKKPWILRFMDNNNRFLITQLNSGKVLICEIEFL